MISALLIDDEPMARESLQILLNKMDDIRLDGVFSSAIGARKYLKSNTVDVIFLDVEMPGLTGLEFLASTKKLPEVIMVTSNPDYAVDAFEYCVTDFLTKPINFNRLYKAIERVREKLAMDHYVREDFFVKSEGKFIRIPFKDLLFVETMDDYVILNMIGQRKVIVHSTLCNIRKKLPAHRFQKIHRSYIINLSKIIDIHGNTLDIDHRLIPISCSYRTELIHRLGI